jgi:glutamate racemase
MIGFFDSGIGGLTILSAVQEKMPSYDMVYLGDMAHFPYGDKTHDQLVEYTWDGVERLFKHGCRLVIVACNSASSGALREIQRTKLAAYPNHRILGIIRPTVEALSDGTFRRVTILSTEATRKSGAYAAEFKKLNPAIFIISHACPNWASMIEAGLAGTQEMAEEVQKELMAVEKEAPNQDAILLACTHYPYVKSDVEKALHNKVPVFNQGELVAESLIDYLERHPEIESNLKKGGKRAYFTTGNAARASENASKQFGFEVEFQEVGEM